ncbi:MAG TPA: ComF family protein [Casimicrobiaceae bacterium]|nr:ComF family protein [Casimicrobiaceae bacterium]
MSNFLASAFDSVRKSALGAARRALPQRCELCAAPSGDCIICGDCSRELPWIEHACPVCALPTAGDEICGQCLANPPPFDATIAACAYAFPVDRLIHAFKYQRRLALADWCADAILAAHRRRPSRRPRCLIALPLSEERQRERGCNQAAEIARVLAAKAGIALMATGVRRTRTTPPQAALPWSERARNVRGAFCCDADVKGLSVAVVDDVMTTGATLAEFAKTLKAAGAIRVENWVVARTLPAVG